VRLDQSICPSDRSNTRMAADMNGGAWCTGRAGCPMVSGDAGEAGSGAVSLI
jgi:hypothetical protein